VLHFATNIVDAVREFRAFREAKRIKREPLVWSARAVQRSHCRPRALSDVDALRSDLRENADYARASEQLDRLEAALRHRWQHGFPLPEDFVQESDRSLWMSWGNGLTVRAFPDFLGSVVGGTAGEIKRGITGTLLDALHMASRIRLAR
jgi:hypothetical protein